MKKKSKQYLFFFLALLLFCSCGKKKSIHAVILENTEIFQDEAESAIEEYVKDRKTYRLNKEMTEELKNTVDILKDTEQWGQNAEIYMPRDYGDDIVIEYECSATGLMTATYQWGFYYSRDDIMHISFLSYAFGDLTEEEDGLYVCREQGGDNYYETKKICDHFYYYATGN